MKRRHAIVVDDDAMVAEFLCEALAQYGFTVRVFRSAEEAIPNLATSEADLLVSDLRLPGMDGLGLIARAREVRPDIATIVLTAFGTVETAVHAIRSGAEDFLLKPISLEQLELVLSRIDASRAILRENKALRASLSTEKAGMPAIVGSDSRFIQALALAERVASTEATVLVRGESGTGKEVVASLLHFRSRRAKGPFIRVNCAALTESLLTSELFGHEKGAFTGALARKEGRFELASGGTLFLDEIGEISLDVQAKLLRILETGEYERVGGSRSLRSDARIVAATNRDLEAAISEGKFREDLFYRLNVVPITLPPLRERREDIPALSSHFLRKYAREFGSPARELSPAAATLLMASNWPGNIRELANVMQRAALVATGPVVNQEDLGLVARLSAATRPSFAGRSLEEVERTLILETLEATRWNRTEAAKLLGVTSRTLSNKIRLWRALGLVNADV